MVKNCCVVGCKNYVGKKEGLRFFRFPLTYQNRCMLWTAAVKRKAWKPGKSTRICNEHFISGEPSSLPSNPDYTPSIFPSEYGATAAAGASAIKMERYERWKKRALSTAPIVNEEANTTKEVSKENHAVEEADNAFEEADKENHVVESCAMEKDGNEEASEGDISECVQEDIQHLNDVVEPDGLSTSGRSTQTDIVLMIDSSTQSGAGDHEFESLLNHNKKLRSRVFSVAIIQGNDNATKFYTGLPSYGMFVHVFEFLTPFVTPGCCVALDDEFFAVLVRLRLNLFVDDLAFRLGISHGSVVKIFQKWLDVMFERLHFLIAWPSRDTLEANMPLVFKQLYPNCRVIIDCSEIFIETPASFSARSKTYSNYKKHNTVKFLIGVTPCGTISYLSHCWGGRVSDKTLTQECGFLTLLEPGDIVLADRGFTVEDDVALHGARLEIPAFTRGKKQLSQEDIEKSKQLSKVRIHVERVIGLLKNRYIILKGTLNIGLIKHKGDNNVANIDKLLVVCSALTNLGEPNVVGCA